MHTDELFRFSQGKYRLELIAKLVGRKRLVSLWSGELDMPAGAFDTTIAIKTAVFFNWSSEKNEYLASIEERSGYMHAVSDTQS